MASFLKPAPVSFPLAAIENPRCARCSTRMALTKLEPRQDGFEKRIFECTKCHFMTTKMLADPLRSDTVRRLANSVVPPT
jgi:hypothetical protein